VRRRPHCRLEESSTVDWKGRTNPSPSPFPSVVGVAGVEPAILLIPNQAAYHQAFAPKKLFRWIDSNYRKRCQKPPSFHWTTPDRKVFPRKDSNLQSTASEAATLAN
jgi:hypothetical protein